jgi:dipeptidyl aminopeptidase/acylaminoacyl peptidase
MRRDIRKVILDAISAQQLSAMLCLFMVVASASAAVSRPPTVDELIGLQTPDAPVISPDGRFVAYTVRRPNWADNRYETQVWLANTETSSLIQLTNAKESSYEPTWSPDGRWLGFVSDRDGTSQVYIISPTGGEARRITHSTTDVLEFHWSPDGKRIAFTAPDPESDQIKRRKEKYSDFELVRHDYRMNHLWIADMIAQTAQRVTRGNEYTVDSFSWSPDGRRLAFDARTAPTFSAEPTSNIYICNLDDGAVKKLVDEQGPDRNPHWSPDGKSIAFETVLGRPNFFTQNIHIGVVPAEGGAVTDLTPDFDERAALIDWGPRGIYFSAEQKTAAYLFAVDLPKRTIQQVSPKNGAVYGSFNMTPDFKQVAFIEADSTHYPEIYVSPLKNFAPKKLTDYARQLKGLTFATREVVSWKNSEGTPIEGVLLKPLDFDPTKRYPLLVMLHGGPGDTTSQAVLGLDATIRYYPTEIWAAKDALVLEPNYRGSAGYGVGFHRLSFRTIGAGDYDDIISGVDSLIANGWVDKDRVGVMGWSFGGYISAWIATNSDRFKAVSVGAGATDMVLLDATTDMQMMTRQYLGAAPSNDLEIYRKSSPITNAKRGKTPTMIQHGEFDPFVPIGGAYELYQALTDQGTPARFYLYKGFGHSITNPKGSRAVLEHNLNWFNHYLWGMPDQETPN